MTKARYIIIAMALLLGRTATSQSVIPEISFGWGEYRMEELKDAQSSIISPVQLKTVNSFPPYYFYKAALYYDLSGCRFGLSLGHYSTGSRNYYSDYSGEISLKQLIHTNVYSFPFYLKLNKTDRVVFSLMIEPGIMSTKYTVVQDMRVWSEKAHDSYSERLTNLSVQPGLSCTYSVKRWQPSVNFGYFFDTKILIRSFDNEININKVESDYSDFSGLRVSVSLAYRIH
jgi:hypothetical protein